MTSDTPIPRQAFDLAEAAKTVETIHDLVRVGVSAFTAANLSYGHGTSGAYDESVALVLWALHLPPDSPDILFAARVTPAETALAIQAMTSRINSRAPLGYITGETWFRGLRFLSDRRALIPRSLLVEAMQESLTDWLEIHQPEWFDLPLQDRNILDLCTGGGSVAIHAALQFPSAAVTAVDIDAQALALCRENLALHNLSEQVVLCQSDLFDKVTAPARFDLVLSNPPYVPTASMARLPDEFQAEPEIALAAGTEGMQVIKNILTQTTDRLTPDGLLILEIGHQIDDFLAAFPGLSFAALAVDAGDEMILLMTSDQLREAAIQ